MSSISAVSLQDTQQVTSPISVDNSSLGVTDDSSSQTASLIDQINSVTELADQINDLLDQQQNASAFVPLR